MARNETHSVREGQILQIGDTQVILKQIKGRRIVVRVVDPDGRRIRRFDPEPIDRERLQAVES